MRHLTRALLGLGLCVGFAVPPVSVALGGDPAWPRLSADAWTFTAMPYAWTPYLQGHQTVKGRTVDIYANPFQVLEHLDAAPWMSYVEARRGRLAIYNDIFYAKLGVHGSRARSFDQASLDVQAEVQFEQAIIEGGAAYELGRWRSGGGVKDSAPARLTALDVIVGARYWHQDMSVRL